MREGEMKLLVVDKDFTVIVVLLDVHKFRAMIYELAKGPGNGGGKKSEEEKSQGSENVKLQKKHHRQTFQHS